MIGDPDPIPLAPAGAGYAARARAAIRAPLFDGNGTLLLGAPRTR
jgi:hypothetical protein